ncbi:PepSY domain-containing protein [Rhodospirillum centenum]|uniref:Uncharacterized protein n=1 Tax=Rhodospirillum centenum (strain ATCC 51521 / SW) TaxID=414684 RepID=B6IND9_RHOCS|nr:PepSY domain-containing protein [Rhodospirillum centenum]ACI99036.1 conserved hypothetical protein [Rhodospirillum centenum SW]
MTALAAALLLGSAPALAQEQDTGASGGPGGWPAQEPSVQQPGQQGRAPDPGDPAAGSGAGSGMDAAEAPATGGTEVLVEIDEVDDARLGPAQRRLSVMQTTLLNRFSQLGFSDVRAFRREGESYVAEAVDGDGQEVTVVLDPASGTIVARR